MVITTVPRHAANDDGVLFPLGRIVATRGALQQAREWGAAHGRPDGELVLIASLLRRHASGDWGDLDPEDAALNDAAVRSGEERVFSAYALRWPAMRFWIITEADRSVTTVLLPEEY